MTYWIKAANGPRVREAPEFTPWGSYVVLPTPDWIVPYRVCKLHKGAVWYLVYMNDGNEVEINWTLNPKDATLFDKEGAINESSYYEARYMEAA